MIDVFGNLIDNQLKTNDLCTLYQKSFLITEAVKSLSFENSSFHIVYDGERG